MCKKARNLVRTTAAVLLGVAGTLPAGLAFAQTASGTTSQSQSSPQASAKMPMSKELTVHRESVERLQTALNDHGYKLKVDGILGPNTRAAIQNYQSKNGLQVTGKADSKTMKSLGIG